MNCPILVKGGFMNIRKFTFFGGVIMLVLGVFSLAQGLSTSHCRWTSTSADRGHEGASGILADKGEDRNPDQSSI